MNLLCYLATHRRSEVTVGLMCSGRQVLLSAAVSYSSIWYLQMGALWTNNTPAACLSVCHRRENYYNWPQVYHARICSKQMKVKMSAINTYGEPNSSYNYQHSACSISDHYIVISVGGCKVVLTALVIDRMESLWAEFQLAHKKEELLLLAGGEVPSR